MTDQERRERQRNILVDNPPVISDKVNVPPEIKHLTITKLKDNDNG